jgi:hypothetical protein
MRYTKIFSLLALASIGLSAQAQFSQPWTPNAKGFTTRVPNCSTPNGLPGAAYDDFISATTSNLTKLVWWGNVSGPAQLNKQVVVVIYRDLPAACSPDLSAPIYTTCVAPISTTLVGMDCLGRRVYRFRALLPGGVTVTPGTKYWLQISENDAVSVTPGADDFKWCGHFGNVGCPAIQISPTGVTVQPLTGCGALCDLAFRIL